MPITCSPDDLADSVSCLQNQDQQTLLAQMVYLLCQLNSMSCDPDTLAEIDEVKCLQNWDQQSLLAAAVFQLCELNGGGGPNPPPPPPSTSWKQIYENNGDPNGVVTPEYAGVCICLDTSGSGDIWWNTSGVLDSNAWY